MQNPGPEGEHGGNADFVQVAIHTTAGSYPEDGYDKHNPHQPIRQILQQADKALKITDTAGWVALVNEGKINLDQSYSDQGLSGQIDIDWGPEEGGGGCTN